MQMPMYQSGHLYMTLRRIATRRFIFAMVHTGLMVAKFNPKKFAIYERNLL
jgi:hypothetical protein